MNSERERRRLQRNVGSSLGQIAWQLNLDSSLLKTRVHNFTIQGLAIVADRPVSHGKRITIYFVHRSGPVILDAHVKHATRIGNGQWLLGCQFERYLTADDVVGTWP